MKLLEGVEHFFLTANVEIIIDGKKIWTVVAVLETVKSKERTLLTLIILCGCCGCLFYHE